MTEVGRAIEAGVQSGTMDAIAPIIEGGNRKGGN